MDFRRPTPILAVVLLVVAVALFGHAFGLLPWSSAPSDRATVTITDENGTTLATVDAEVADTPDERYVGLSRHDSLGEDEGMLFVFDDETERTFVMRDMDFPIDVIFVDGDGRITTIYEAPVEDGFPLTRYRGRARWVLEVRYGYAEENGISAGDRVSIDYDGSQR